MQAVHAMHLATLIRLMAQTTFANQNMFVSCNNAETARRSALQQTMSRNVYFSLMLVLRFQKVLFGCSCQVHQSKFAEIPQHEIEFMLALKKPTFVPFCKLASSSNLPVAQRR